MLTLKPILSFCTATSIKKTASSSNAAAVASIRLSQRASSLFIAVEEHQFVVQIFGPEPTSQSYPRNVLTYGPQIVLLKDFLGRLFPRLLGCINTWVFRLAVFQIIFDISQELVVFHEHGNDRNFKSDALV